MNSDPDSVTTKILWLPISNDVLSFNRRVIGNPRAVLGATWLFIIIAFIVSVLVFTSDQDTTALTADRNNGVLDSDLLGCVNPTLSNEEVRTLMQYTDPDAPSYLCRTGVGQPSRLPGYSGRYTSYLSVQQSVGSSQMQHIFLTTASIDVNTEVANVSSTTYTVGSSTFASTFYDSWFGLIDDYTDSNQWPTGASRRLVDFYNMLTTDTADEPLQIKSGSSIRMVNYSDTSAAGLDQFVLVEIPFYLRVSRVEFNYRHFYKVVSLRSMLADVTMTFTQFKSSSVKLANVFPGKVSDGTHNYSLSTVTVPFYQGFEPPYLSLGDTSTCWEYARQKTAGTVCFKESAATFQSSLAKALSIFMSFFGVVALVTKICVRQYTDADAAKDEFQASAGLAKMEIGEISSAQQVASAPA